MHIYDLATLTQTTAIHLVVLQLVSCRTDPVLHVRMHTGVEVPLRETEIVTIHLQALSIAGSFPFPYSSIHLATLRPREPQTGELNK